MTVHRPLVFIGLGSNLHRPIIQIKKALRFLSGHRGVRLLAYSSIYETAPIGYDDQPKFINAVAKLTTNYSPHRLLDLLQKVEHLQHRKRTSNQNSPRTLDLDILLYGQFRCRTDRLILPHPRMHERRFVLQPLLELAPELVIPGKGPAVNFQSSVSSQGCQRKARILLN